MKQFHYLAEPPKSLRGWGQKIPLFTCMMSWLSEMRRQLRKERKRLEDIELRLTTKILHAPQVDKQWPDPFWRDAVFLETATMHGSLCPFAMLQIQEGNRW